MGFAAYLEHKELDNNFMELLQFCVNDPGKKAGIRFMSEFLKWAHVKKFYSEVVTMADLTAVEFFDKCEFVMTSKREFQKKAKIKL